MEVPYTLEDGIAGAIQLLERPEPPTAIFCSNDILAFGAMRAALDRGLSLPADLSVIGFDNSPMAAVTSPRLTTVSQPAYDMGARACDLLCSLIDGENPTERGILLPTELCVRDTTAPPRA